MALNQVMAIRETLYLFFNSQAYGRPSIPQKFWLYFYLI